MSKWLTVENKTNNKAKINISGYIGYPSSYQKVDESDPDFIATKEEMRKEVETILKEN